METFSILEFSLGLLVGSFLVGLAKGFISWTFVEVWLVWFMFLGTLALFSGMLFAFGIYLVIRYNYDTS